LLKQTLHQSGKLTGVVSGQPNQGWVVGKWFNAQKGIGVGAHLPVFGR